MRLSRTRPRGPRRHSAGGPLITVPTLTGTNEGALTPIPGVDSLPYNYAALCSWTRDHHSSGERLGRDALR